MAHWPRRPRGAVVGLDPVAEADGHAGAGHAPMQRGRVEVVAQQRHVGRLPAAAVVIHTQQVGDEHVVVG